MNVNKISINSRHYPEKLKNIPDPPKNIYTLGDIKLLDFSPSLAVVGSRKVTPYGRSVTDRLAGKAAANGLLIVSGLALGVDSVAHKAALDNNGKTVAVLPSGLDKPYPATHRQLAKKILQKGGLLISEYPEGTPPLPHYFIARNRIVSALGDGVLVTEAAKKSGTIHTAGFALDQGKTVMAVPGNITSQMSEGTNNLIRSGAIPITEEQDIFDALGLGVQLQLRETLGSNQAEDTILKLIRSGVSDAHELQSASKLDASEFNQTLTMLEISGKIRPIGAGHWTIN